MRRHVPCVAAATYRVAFPVPLLQSTAVNTGALRTPSSATVTALRACAATSGGSTSTPAVRNNNSARRNSASSAAATAASAELTGWRRRKATLRLVGSIAFLVIVSVGVTLREEQTLAKRHTSIEKDIERERWRARELGLASTDDGFADRYMGSIADKGTATSPSSSSPRR